MRFTHLHVASAFSARYGTASPETLVAAAAEQGADAAAITDRDGLYGAIRHVRACIAAGIDPIVGAELQFRTSGDQLRDIVVLAHGRAAGAGWAALSRVVSASHGASRGIAKMQNGAAHRSAHLTPSRVSAVLHGDGPPNTTVLLGPGSDVGFALQHRRVAEARQLLDRWRALLPGGVMLEVVCHHTHPDKAGSLRHAADMLSLARASGTPAVLTNRVRYLTPDDAVTGDVLDAAGQLAALGTFQPQPNAQGWLKPPKKMHLIAKSIAEQAGLGQQAASDLLSTTERLADTCRLDPDADLRWRKPKVPEASVIGIDGDPTLALWQKCEVAIGERYPDASHTLHTRIRDRLRLELGTIEHFGFETYFLTVADVVSLIRERGIRARREARAPARSSTTCCASRASTRSSTICCSSASSATRDRRFLTSTSTSSPLAGTRSTVRSSSATATPA